MRIRIDRLKQKEAIHPLANFLRIIWENTIRLFAGDRKFYNTKEFKWIKEFENNIDGIKKEVDSILNEDIKSWQEISNDPNVKMDEKWKTYILKAYTHTIESNALLMPQTYSIIEKNKQITTAWISIMEPHTKLDYHRGPYNGVLRYHLGITIPSTDKNKCGIDIDGEVRNWEYGKSLVFDDSHIHSAWNLTDSTRVVLFIDFIRPLTFPLNIINKLIIYLASNSKFIKGVIKNAS